MEEPSVWAVLASIFMGVGLSAACGYRVFVPLTIGAVAAKAEMLPLADGFDWLGSWPAIICFSLASLLEIGAYYIPFIDNALDAVASPMAIIAGVILSASVMLGDMSPMMRWTLAAIAGGGAAGAMQGSTVALRAASSSLTAGTGNAMVSTTETGTSIFMTFLAIVFPIFAGIAVLIIGFFLVRFAIRKLRAAKEKKAREETFEGVVTP